MKIKRVLLSLLVLLLTWWNWPRPQLFLSKVGIRAPKGAAIYHNSRWYLKSEAHFVKITLPAKQTAGFIAQFAKKRHYVDISAHLKQHYKEFVSGREDFFPAPPQSCSGGTFDTTDGIYFYHFSYLIDWNKGTDTDVYLYAISPDD